MLGVGNVEESKFLRFVRVYFLGGKRKKVS